MSKTASILLASLLVISCQVSCQNKKNSVDKESSLKKAYSKEFYIGTALDNNQINENDAAVNHLIVTQFNDPSNLPRIISFHIVFLIIKLQTIQINTFSMYSRNNSIV